VPFLKQCGLLLALAMVVLVALTRQLAPASEPAWASQARPEPLTAAEERSPAALRIARRFNPAMAFADPGIWPVPVQYAWRDGSDLTAQVMEDGRAVASYVARPNAALDRSWGDLPDRDPQGRDIRYSIDAPGDDQTVGGRTRWRQRWEALTGQQAGQPPNLQGEFPPTQYAHVFWYNRAKGLLGVQYWFFYPFNEWINRHEGDWEHINVILRGPSYLDEDAEFSPEGYQFAFHRFRLQTDHVVRVAGPQTDEDHVLVFVGGRGRLLWWGGKLSGGSYPLPARYAATGDWPFSPGEDTRRPERFIAAGDFDVVLLPEPERLDTRARPELSWLKLPLYLGQEKMRSNPPLFDWLGAGGPVLQPGRRSTWNAVKGKRAFGGPVTWKAQDLALPKTWSLRAAPWLPPAVAVAK
jgi:hypothetical protein